MPNKKKKRSKGTLLPLAALFAVSHSDEGYDSDNEHEENRAWAAERDRQKAASCEAAAHGQRKAQIAVLLGEDNDFRANLVETEKTARAHLEDNISETLIEHEWIEFVIARREAEEQKQRAKKAPFIQLGTQQMLHRAHIADKETENRISFFNGFTASMNRAKEAEKDRLAKEKLESDRRKAAERARVFEERARKSTANKTAAQFQVINTPPAGSTEEPKAPQTGGWLSGWFFKS